jgi:hypothetical protein
MNIAPIKIITAAIVESMSVSVFVTHPVIYYNEVVFNASFYYL